MHGGGATWLTGSYDPQLKTLYWGTGNPGPDWNGDSRVGDNLYTSSLVALDVDTIVESVKRTGRLVIAHEAYERGGIAGEIAMQVSERAFDYLDAPIVRVAGANVPVPYNLTLERDAVPQTEQIVAAVRGMF